MLSLPDNKNSYTIVKADGNAIPNIGKLQSTAETIRTRLAVNAREAGRFHVLTESIVHTLLDGTNAAIIYNGIACEPSNPLSYTLKVNFADLRNPRENRAGYYLVKFIIKSHR